MGYGIKLHVRGERACFTRPEMKVERVSYDVITPSAARGILEAIHWKPAIRWEVTGIQVLKPIRFESIRRNEVGGKLSAASVKKAMKANSTKGLNYLVDDGKNRQQRAATILRDVEYIIHAHFQMTDKAGSDDNVGKHLDIFNRRAAKGQCFHQPYMGTREFPVDFSPWNDQDDFKLTEELSGERDLGWMLHDMDFGKQMEPRFFRARMVNGFIEVPKWNDDGVLS